MDNYKTPESEQDLEVIINRLATNATQHIVWRWEGEAFGNTPAQTNWNVIKDWNIYLDNNPFERIHVVE